VSRSGFSTNDVTATASSPSGGSRSCAPDRGLECRRIPYYVIRGHDQQYRIRILLCLQERRQGDCRRRVAAFGFEDDSCLYTDFRELLGNQEAMGLVTDDKTVSSHTGHSLETSRCLLQQSLLSGQRQELLRVHCA
jgi:hypothetical protein